MCDSSCDESVVREEWLACLQYLVIGGRNVFCVSDHCSDPRSIGESLAIWAIV